MRKSSVLAVLAFIFLGLTNLSFASEPIMSLEEVERLIDSSPNKEVQAIFKSVERGTKLSTYDVILRGIYKQPGLKVIMFVTKHKIVAGMSGSPVYVNSKLVGALAYSFNGFNFSDWSWGGISPISLMMDESKLVDQKPSSARSFNYNSMSFEPIPVGSHIVLGMSSVLRGGKFFKTTSSNTFSKGEKPVSLRAGMPIVVDIIEYTDEKGETSTVGALGTITYIGDDGKIFAFGHPFLDSRKVVYGFRTAEIMGTIYSETGSNKVGGKTSEILGAITFDGSYGIYGSVSNAELSKLHNFNLEFKIDGKSLHRFDIKVADSTLTPLLSKAIFGIIGSTNGAPLPEEPSATQFETRVDIKDQKSVLWKELFASSVTKFGPATIYTSSYDIACEAFFSKIYSSLFVNQYGLKVSQVSVVANFSSSRDRVLKFAGYKFPNKVIWGEDPVLEVLFVSEDNSIALAKSIKVKIDWNKIEKPIYKKTNLDIEKEQEKIVGGMLRIDSTHNYLLTLSDDEKQTFSPEYFLGPEDFLNSFSRKLEATNQKIFVRLFVRARSGLFDETIAKTDNLIPRNVDRGDDSGWYVIQGGLAERKQVLRNNNLVNFYVNMPSAPSGYIVNEKTLEAIYFEVVLDQ